MKTIGLLGGMSWESTLVYYRLINEQIKRRLGGLSSAKIVLISVNLAELHALQEVGDWVAAGEFLKGPARQAQAAGADLLAICTNTMHKVADEVTATVDIPLVHIADATAAAIKAAGMSSVGLLGTRFTMEQQFYKERLIRQGIEVLTPDGSQRALVHRVIYDELCLGEIREESRAQYLTIIDGLVAAGAQGIVQGCTEIGLLVKPEHTEVALFDTAAVHVEAIVSAALA